MMQYLAKNFGGKVEASNQREYGRANLQWHDTQSILFKGIDQDSQVWMSHGDTIVALPNNFTLIGSTKEVEVAANISKSPVGSISPLCAKPTGEGAAGSGVPAAHAAARYA